MSRLDARGGLTPATMPRAENQPWPAVGAAEKAGTGWPELSMRLGPAAKAVLRDFISRRTSDRIGVVDKFGNLIYGDQLMVIYAKEILSRHPGATFISEVKCSMAMYDQIAKMGGNAIMWRTGHSLIKKKMKEEDAALAGEMSGHMFFKDRYYGYDDALYASCRLLEIMDSTGLGVDELIKDLPKTFTTPEIRVDCPDEVKFRVVEKIVELYKSRQKVIDIDGMRAIYEDGWGLVRASNTQPALVLRFEALTESRLEEIRTEIETDLKKIIEDT